MSWIDAINATIEFAAIWITWLQVHHYLLLLPVWVPQVSPRVLFISTS